jgi:hypothetical protein
MGQKGDVGDFVLKSEHYIIGCQPDLQSGAKIQADFQSTSIRFDNFLKVVKSFRGVQTPASSSVDA